MTMDKIKYPIIHHNNKDYTFMNENRCRTFDCLIYCPYDIYRNLYIDVSFLRKNIIENNILLSSNNMQKNPNMIDDINSDKKNTNSENKTKKFSTRYHDSIWLEFIFIIFFFIIFCNILTIIYIVNEETSLGFRWIFVICKIATWPIEKIIMCIKKIFCPSSNVAIIHDQPEKIPEVA